MKNNKAFTLIEGLIVLIVVAVIAVALFRAPLMGIFPFGPTGKVECTINRLYVDSGGKEEGSHYMVGTDKGVFEVENSAWASVTNADELYSILKEGKRYRLTTKGDKVVGYFYQEYPRITAIEEIK